MCVLVDGQNIDQQDLGWLQTLLNHGSKNLPTYPWNIPQTPNHQSLEEFFSFSGLGMVEGYALGGMLRLLLDLDSYHTSTIPTWIFDPPGDRCETVYLPSRATVVRRWVFQILPLKLQTHKKTPKAAMSMIVWYSCLRWLPKKKTVLPHRLRCGEPNLVVVAKITLFQPQDS